MKKLVAYEQVPHMLDMGDEEMEQVPGIDDKYWYNFDHIPIWYEPVRNHSWGRLEGNIRIVSPWCLQYQNRGKS